MAIRLFSALQKHIEQQGIDLCLIGLRREESNKRNIRARKLLEKSSFEKVMNAFPLREWTWLDVWAYIVEHTIPYPSSYNKKAKLEGWQYSRFVTFFDPEFENLNQYDNYLFWKYKEVK